MQQAKKVSYLEQTSSTLTSRAETAEADVRALEDECDILKSKAALLAKAELSIDKYKKKIEEAAVMQAHMGELEAKNAKYLDQILELESTVKTSTALKRTCDELKDKVAKMEREKVSAAHTLVSREAAQSVLCGSQTARSGPPCMVCVWLCFGSNCAVRAPWSHCACLASLHSPNPPPPPP